MISILEDDLFALREQIQEEGPHRGVDRSTIASKAGPRIPSRSAKSLAASHVREGSGSSSAKDRTRSGYEAARTKAIIAPSEWPDDVRPVHIEVIQEVNDVGRLNAESRGRRWRDGLRQPVTRSLHRALVPRYRFGGSPWPGKSG